MMLYASLFWTGVISQTEAGDFDLTVSRNKATTGVVVPHQVCGNENLGVGFDALTLDCRGSPFDGVIPKCADVSDPNTPCMFGEKLSGKQIVNNQKIQNTQQFNSALEIAAEFEGTGFGITIGASAKFMSTSTSESKSVTFLQWQSGDAYTDMIRNPKALVLSDIAKFLLYHDYNQFIDLFGTHYLIQEFRSTSFMGSMELYQSSSEGTEHLEVAMHWNFWDMFTGKFSVKHMVEQSKGALDVNLRVNYKGTLKEMLVGDEEPFVQLRAAQETWMQAAMADPMGMSEPSRMLAQPWSSNHDFMKALFDASKWKDMATMTAAINTFVSGGVTGALKMELMKETASIMRALKDISTMLSWRTLPLVPAYQRQLVQARKQILHHQAELEGLDDAGVIALDAKVQSGDATFFKANNQVWRSLLNEISMRVQCPENHAPHNECFGFLCCKPSKNNYDWRDQKKDCEAGHGKVLTIHDDLQCQMRGSAPIDQKCDTVLSSCCKLDKELSPSLWSSLNCDIVVRGSKCPYNCDDCSEWGIDFNGHDVNHQEGVKSAYDCKKLCVERSYCQFWTYRTDGKKCYFKSSDEGRIQRYDGASGPAFCPGDLSVANYYKGVAGGQCPAQDVIKTIGECAIAHRALGLHNNHPWSGPSGSLPAGCSTRQNGGNDMLFNTKSTGAPNPSAVPLCKGLDDFRVSASHGNETTLFDPTSTLASYEDVDSCGPRGSNALADFTQCAHGHTLVEELTVEMLGMNSSVVTTIDGCGYLSFNVYRCLEEDEVFAGFQNAEGRCPSRKTIEKSRHCGKTCCYRRCDEERKCNGFESSQKVSAKGKHKWTCKLFKETPNLEETREIKVTPNVNRTAECFAKTK